MQIGTGTRHATSSCLVVSLLHPADAKLTPGRRNEGYAGLLRQSADLRTQP